MITDQTIKQICELMSTIGQMCLNLREQSAQTASEKRDSSPVTIGDLAVQLVVSKFLAESPLKLPLVGEETLTRSSPTLVGLVKPF